jgi:predicted small secreted protein
LLYGWWALIPLSFQGEIKMFRTLIAVMLVAFFASACNTMSGAGKDIERGGEKIQGAAERNK